MNPIRSLFYSLALITPFQINAQVTYTWDDGGNNNSWNKSANWVGGNIPDGTNHIAYFNGLQSGIGSTGTKVYVTNEAGDVGTTRNLYGLSFLTENSNEQWRIYGNKGEAPNKNVKLRIHNRISHNLLNDGTASILCTLEIVNDITWSMNGGFVLLSQPLDGTGDINGVSGPQIDGLGGVRLRGLGNYTGTITTGQGTIDVIQLDVLKNAGLNLNDPNANRLTYADGANIGEIKGNGILTLSGTLNAGFNNSDTTLSGVISGTGNFSKRGTGTLTMTADNLYTGTTSINGGGALQLGDGGTSGSLTGPITIGNNNTLIYNRSDHASYSNIGGGGKVEVLGSGTLTLLGDHTNLSRATATNGILVITRDDSGPLSIVDRITSNSETHLVKHGNWLNSYDGVISGSGSVLFDGGQKESKFRLSKNQTYTGGTRIEKGTLYLGVNNAGGWVEGDIINNGFVRFNRSDDKTFPGLISGTGGLEKHQTSTITLTADNTYQGATSISGGTLRIDGSIASGNVSVGGAGTLEGNGTIGGAVTSAGTISPGSSAGTLTVTNDVTITGDYLAEIDGTNSDLLDVSGNLDISSATLDIDVLAGGATEQVYLIASYGSLTGTFSSVQNLPAGFQLDYAFGGNNIAIIETLQPIVTSITTSQASPTNANSITYTVTFSEVVSGFDAFDDLVMAGGATATGATISNPSNDNTTYLVALTGITGNDTISFSVTDGGATPIFDAALNSFTTTGSAGSSSITIDNTGPIVTSFTTAESSPTNANSIDYTVIFSEEVFDLSNSSDYHITGATNSGGVDQASITETIVNVGGSNTQFIITLNNITGDVPLRFRLNSNNISDASGYIVSQLNPFSPNLIIDNTAPIISLTGSDLTQVVGDPWDDPGSSADDGSTVQIAGDPVLINTPGVYTITYDATDDAGNIATQVTRTVTIISVYDSWTSTNGLTGNDDLPTADPEGDGFTNLEEFAFDRNPNSKAQEIKTSIHLTNISTTDYLAITLPVRSGAAFSSSPSPTATVDGIIYTIQGTLSLDDWTESLTEVTPVESSGLPALSSGWEYRTFRFVESSLLQSQGFFRIATEQTP